MSREAALAVAGLDFGANFYTPPEAPVSEQERRDSRGRHGW